MPDAECLMPSPWHARCVRAHGVNYGLYISASGALTAMYRQDVHANNLANLDTVGFKPDFTATLQRLTARQEDGLTALPSDEMLERLGAGAHLAPNRIGFGQGPLDSTEQPFDLAIQGDGFFVTRTDGSNIDSIRLTRDGRFTRDPQGRLVLAGSGLPVLDTANNTIRVPDGPGMRIEGDGSIFLGERFVARIQVTDVLDRSQLTKEGHSLFRPTAAALDARFAASGAVRQGFLERSSTDPFRAMMATTSAGREFETNMQMIAQHDRLMDRAINTLGRVS